MGIGLAKEPNCVARPLYAGNPGGIGGRKLLVFHHGSRYHIPIYFLGSGAWCCILGHWHCGILEVCAMGNQTSILQAMSILRRLRDDKGAVG